MDVRRPSITRALVGIALATALALTGCSESTPDNPTSSSPAAQSAPAQPPKGMPGEDPGAIVKGTDLKEVGGPCTFKESLPHQGQGVQSHYNCDDDTVLSATEIRGEEAEAYWRKIKGLKSYQELPKVSPNARLASGEAIVVFAGSGEDSFLVEVGVLSATKPLDDNALAKLGRLIAEKITA